MLGNIFMCLNAIIFDSDYDWFLLQEKLDLDAINNQQKKEEAKKIASIERDAEFLSKD